MNSNMKNDQITPSESRAKTVFACSGAADLGQISDMAARKLNRDGNRQMKCLAFISAGIEDMIDSIRDSDMLVIDGCQLDCGRLTMERNGLSGFSHLRLTDMGYVKGQTPPDSELVKSIVSHAVEVY